MRFKAVWLSSLAVTAAMVTVAMTGQAQTATKTRHRRSRAAVSYSAASGSTSVKRGKAGALAVVNQFEKAYQRKDKQTMIMKLMVPVPSTDNNTLEKRYQWLRGYGPHDLPGSRHQPILFETSKGSFVPDSYTVTKVTPDGDRWKVQVREHGIYRDEDGRYDVSRARLITVTPYKGNYYVMDYVLMENPEDYGFYVDDISDKMTHLGK